VGGGCPRGGVSILQVPGLHGEQRECGRGDSNQEVPQKVEEKMNIDGGPRSSKRKSWGGGKKR